MATLTAQQIVRAGLEATYAAAAAGGDEFVNDGARFVHVKNDDASAKVVTLETQATVDGLAVTDRTVSVPAGEDRFIGPFPTGTYNDADNKLQITYDDVTSVTIAVLEP